MEIIFKNHQGAAANINHVHAVLPLAQRSLILSIVMGILMLLIAMKTASIANHHLVNWALHASMVKVELPHTL